MGYDDNESDINQTSSASSSAVKKQKYYVARSEDWDYLIASTHSKNFTNLNKMLKLTTLMRHFKLEETAKKIINPKNILFPYIRIIHFTLHLLYEDMKLNVLSTQDSPHLMRLLYKLSTDMGLTEYIIYYWQDFPDQVTVTYQQSSIPENDQKNIIYHSAFSNTPVSIMKYIYELLSGIQQEAYPYLQNVNTRSRDIVQVFFFNKCISNML